MLPKNTQPFLLTGHRGMTLPTKEDSFTLMGLLYVIYRLHPALMLPCFAKKAGAAGWQPHFSIPA
jgi:hypothetical protein